MKFSNQGVPILPVKDKLNALEKCVLNGSHEDALGHLFDLMAFERSSLQHDLKITQEEQVISVPNWGQEAIIELQDRYGKHPTPIDED